MTIHFRQTIIYKIYVLNFCCISKVKARLSHSWCWLRIKKHSYTLSTRRIQEPTYLTLGDKLASVILCNNSLQCFLHNWRQNTLCIVLT
jgi:hypothetical protein